jgi:membrane protein
MSTDSLRQRIERALAEPGQELGRWARFIQFQIGLWRFCARRLRANNVMAMSAALSFRTIFALIPVLVLAFLVLKSVGVLEDGKRGLRGFLEASGFAQIFVVEGQQRATTTPATESEAEKTKTINVAEQIEATVASVEAKLTFERIGPVGGVLLIWTALTLLTTIERSLNRIFEAPRSRALGRRILLYWSAVTLGPVALVVAAYLGRYVMSTFGDMPGLSWLLVSIGWVGPVIVGILVLSALYTLMPNTTVGYRAAVGGAAVAVVLWLVAKWAFALYVRRLVVTGNLYGVLGVFPLFLMWLNFSWLIFLFGAELAHTVANLHSMQQTERAEKTVLGPSDVLAAAVAIGRPFAADRGLATLAHVAGALRLPTESVRWLIDQLIARGFVCAAEGEDGEARYLLARPAGKIPVAEILAIGDPRGNPDGAARYDDEIAMPVARVQSGSQTALANVTLADVLDHCLQAGSPR